MRYLPIFALVNILCLVFIKPIVVVYYKLSQGYKLLYIISIYGMPIWVLLPIALVMLVFAAWPKEGSLSYKDRWVFWVVRSYYAVSIIFLLVNGLLLYTKYVKKHDPFPHLSYAAITDKAADCSDLHTGWFKSRNRIINRGIDHQTEYSLNYKDTFEYSITWLSDHEYRLINLSGENNIDDTLDVKITNNIPAYYEGFTRLGDYAVYCRVEKNVFTKR